MRIAFLESFYGGSHRHFADGLIAHSQHDWGLFHLPDRHWKWRMHDAAADLAEQLVRDAFQPDLVVTTSLTDVAALRGFLHQAGISVPVVLYMHENQFAYPVSPLDSDATRGDLNHYKYINYSSLRAADHVVFNSAYNRDSLLESLPSFLQQFPDSFRPQDLERIAVKSSVLPVGLDLRSMDVHRMPARTQPPLVLWNHRWAHDKNPDLFFRTLEALSAEGLAFDLAVVGPSQGRAPEVFERARTSLEQHIVQWGRAESREAYVRWLWEAHVLPVTSNQDFFGISVAEAIYCRTIPLMPNRLAFPEHLPGEPVYFEDDRSFKSQLSHILTDPRPFKETWRQRMLGYDWSALAPRFDDFFASCMA